MTYRRFATPTVVALAVCLGASTFIAAPASAADPEDRAVNSLIGKGEGLSPGADESAARSARALVSSASANARITRVLPKRVTYKSVGKKLAVNVVDIDSGARLWTRRANKPFLPASNMKIVTAITALRSMDPDKRFTTRVVSLGKGKVVIVGGGDATLSRFGLEKLARDTAAAINARPDLLPDVTTPAPYRPATCIRKGKRVKSTKKKPCPLVRPSASRTVKVFVDDSLYPSPTRPSGWRSGYEPYVVRPVRALGIDGSYTNDSSAGAAAHFASALKSHGLNGTYKGRRAAGTAEELSSYDGAKLSDQVKYMLQVSENNVAEMLFRNTAIARGYEATWGNSTRAAQEILTELGVPLANMSLASGSGVSRNDRLTANSLTTMLQRVANSTDYPELSAIYYGGGMPLAGRSGTLNYTAGRFNTSPTRCAAGKLRAKTGTLFDTVGLSGLAVGADGRLKAFSVLVNSRPQRFTPLATRRNVDRIAATVTGCY
ncbi:MAG: D-alanyl-D-alanine carboxypeptidase [Candidatus Nanopelagicales bacterium]